MIEFAELSKSYDTVPALESVSFRVRPGGVTALLGPNGSGKTTALKLLLGLERSTSGFATVDGLIYRSLSHPLFKVGAVVDSRNAHPGRTAYSHLRGVALTHGIPKSRVWQVLSEIGLVSVARKRIGGFSLGMMQRLGIAVALLGDPDVLVFDEPTNGLDMDGVLWFRGLVRSLSEKGKTVLFTSHLLSEVEKIADHVVVLSKGRVIADSDIRAFIGTRVARVRSADSGQLANELRRAGAKAVVDGDCVKVTGLDAPDIESTSAKLGIAISEMTFEIPDIENAYTLLTQGETQFTSGAHDPNG
jgi:ABC-2 type transport system ATP-binding protein